jgi:hypothetical protein
MHLTKCLVTFLSGDALHWPRIILSTQRVVSHVPRTLIPCSLSFKICKKVIYCVVALGLTHLESNDIADHVMNHTITLMTVK